MIVTSGGGHRSHAVERQAQWLPHRQTRLLRNSWEKMQICVGEACDDHERPRRFKADANAARYCRSVTRRYGAVSERQPNDPSVVEAARLHGWGHPASGQHRSLLSPAGSRVHRWDACRVGPTFPSFIPTRAHPHRATPHVILLSGLLPAPRHAQSAPTNASRRRSLTHNPAPWRHSSLSDRSPRPHRL